MVTAYMLTIPRTVPKKAIRIMLENNDCKKWIIAKETGRGGYEHWQIRLTTSNRAFFDWCKVMVPQAHVEECTDTWEYERKEGQFWTSDDNPAILGIRFGKPTDQQRQILRIVDQQNDREVDVWYDPTGNHGKTWLSMYLYEKGIGMVVPRSACTAKDLSAYICSAYRGEKYIIIDIPRAGRINTAIYEAIEEIKDGLVFDHRYSGRCRNIRGVRLIIFTNQKLDTSQLSKDRWRLHGFGRENPPLRGGSS